MLSDLEAIKAIDRLCAVSRNLDHIGLREWIAAHCGLNPHAAKPLDPDPAIVAERDTLRATVAALRDKADRLAASLEAAKAALGEARKEAKKERAERFHAGKPVDVDNDANSPAESQAQRIPTRANAQETRSKPR